MYSHLDTSTPVSVSVSVKHVKQLGGPTCLSDKRWEMRGTTSKSPLYQFVACWSGHLHHIFTRFTAVSLLRKASTGLRAGGPELGRYLPWVVFAPFRSGWTPSKCLLSLHHSFLFRPASTSKVFVHCHWPFGLDTYLFAYLVIFISFASGQHQKYRLWLPCLTSDMVSSSTISPG